MITVAQLAAQTYQDVGYVLFIEGWSVAFTDRHELAGAGADSWIGDEAGIGARRTVALGLELPQSIRLAVGLIDSGMLTDDDAAFTVVDREGHLIDFALDEEGDPLIERLSPTDVPAPPTLIGAGGNSVTIHGRHVNGEAIGAEGERRLFQVLPGNPLPGLDHAAFNAPEGEAGLRASVVRDGARWLEGRAVALYLIRRDPATGTWAPWDWHFASGQSLLWWGTLRAARAQSRAWTLECEGPSSWLRRTLNVNRPSEWMPLETPLALGPNENKIAVAFTFRNGVGSPTQAAATSAYTALDTITSDQSPAELAAEINVRLQTLAATAGVDETFSMYLGGQVSLTQDELQIRVADNNLYGGTLQLRMHERAWRHLGMDLRVQGRAPGATLKSIHEVEAIEGSTFYAIAGGATDDPAPGYLEAQFSTVALNAPWSDVFKVDNNGSPRVFRPADLNYVSVLYPDAAQPLKIGVGLDTVYLEGQLARPPADMTLAGVSVNSGVCDAAGFFAVRGSFKASLDGETEMEYQVARVSWVDDDNRVATHSDGRPLVWLEEWLDPRAFGIANDPIAYAWAASDLEFVPIALLGYNLHGPDAAHRVLLRLLLSTGSATWSGVGDDAASTAGTNSHGLGGKGDDLERADLGLGVPEVMVDVPSFAAAADALPGGKGSPLNMTKLAALGPLDSQQLIEVILRPRGWCFSLDGGRYGLFQKAAPLSLDDVQVAITEADVAGEVDELTPAETVEFNALEPIDLIEVRYGASQLGDGGEEKTLAVKARDPRSTLRRGNSKVDIDGRTLTPGGEWSGLFTKLWGTDMARFFGEPHALVTVKVKGSKARDIWPGTVVSYTSPWPATREGGYGMSARVGRVVSVERDLQTLAATVQILVEGRDPTIARRFAPLARLVDGHATVEERHDAENRTVYCYADAFGRGTDESDVAGFAKPAWSMASGDLIAYVWQSWDGLTWSLEAAFYVESVDPTTHSITYKPGTLSGHIWETRFGVVTLAPYEDHDPSAWPQSVFGVVCGPDGKFGAGNAEGFPWVE